METVDEFEYSKKDLVGHGAFAIDHTPVAVKCVSRKNISKSRNLLHKEIDILRELSGLRNENLVTLIKCVETASHVYLVMEYCNAGDLGEYLQDRMSLPERAIQHFLIHIAHAIEAIYKKGIVHRDLKPQNLLLSNPTGKPYPDATELTLKLADFGFARFLDGGTMAATLCGSPMYMAPEVIMSQQYCAKADLWSVGTIIFQCLTGHAPFQAATPPALKRLYERNKELRPRIPAYCSPLLKDLLVGLLKRNARDRIDFGLLCLLQQHAADIPTRGSLADVEGFTFLPPLDNAAARIPSVTTHMTQASAHSSGKSRVDLPSLSPLKQVKVHINGGEVANIHAVPVPSQRTAFAKMIEKQHSTSTTPSKEDSLEKSKTPNRERTCSIPSIEQMNLPPMQFVVRKPSRLPQRDSQYYSKPLSSCTRWNSNKVTSEPVPEVTLPEADVRLPFADVNVAVTNKTIPKSSTHDAPFSTKESATENRPAFSNPCSSNAVEEKSVPPVKPEAPPPVDNIKYLSMSPPHSSASLTVHVTTRQNQQISTSSLSDDDDEVDFERPIYLPFASSAAPQQAGDSSNSQLMESAESNSQMKAEGTDENVLEEVVTPLNEETIMKPEHRQVLAKLRFVLELVNTLIDVAEEKGKLFRLDQKKLLTFCLQKNETSGAYRRAEQLVVYVRALHMLSSALLLAQREVSAATLHPSAAVQQILNQLNEKYHHCLVNILGLLRIFFCRLNFTSMRSQELASLGIPSADPALAVISAERIMYQHAIELCQTAALDELFGRAEYCSQRYQAAYIMLHTLSEQVSSESDKMILSKYKNAVEKRLKILEKQGLVQSFTNN
ncbi:unnamed protein product [Enterobius vermicularis]|uniref:Non-specific serine/threonine protein kinase n=1 Tax=Enterobius vermicularis TaxID=51028 RepID=A0A0N4VBR5_ENTVE|nr:unnamed protein product [Enterobius vermicularis]